MSAECPPGQSTDTVRTAFGQCLDSLRTPRVGTRVPASAPDPTRPDPTRDPSRQRVRAVQQFDQETANSPSPYRSVTRPGLSAESPIQRQVWHQLTAGLHALSENDYGRPWPYPNRRRLAELLAAHDDDLCLKVAQQVREIVISQDRAPNITGLFEKKLRELAEVRTIVRESLEVA